MGAASVDETAVTGPSRTHEYILGVGVADHTPLRIWNGVRSDHHAPA